MNEFIDLLRLAKNYKKRYLIGVVFIILVDIMQLIFPLVFAQITDLFKSGNLSKSNLTFYSFIIFLIGFLIFLFRFIWRYLVQGGARKLEMDIRNKFYSHLTIQDSYFYTQNTSGDLMSHVTNDVNNIYFALGQGLVFLFDSTFIPIFAIIMLFAIGGIKLTLITLIPLVILALTIFLMSNVMQSRIVKMQESFSDLTEFVRETVSGMRVIKTFVQEKSQLAKFAKENNKNKIRNIRYLTLTSMLFPIVMSISGLSFAIIVWYGGNLVIKGQISLGDFVAFNSYVGLLTWPIAAFGWMINIFQRGIVSKKRIDKIMQTKPEIDDSNSDKNITELTGVIEFKNVTFKYPESDLPTLNDISFKVEKGKSLAIIGRTGSGKTTITKLLMRLYDITKGDILIDNIPINKYPFAVLRKQISLVPQDSFLFSETIKNNIAFFRDFSQIEVEKYSKYAQIYDDIKDFPEKYATFIGEKGITLSGGQKQRISIARSLIGEAKVLIFDDCLSAVDTKTEEALLREFDLNLQGKTRIIISNRISAIKYADQILVLNDGEITERGTHKELIAKAGYYFDLYKISLGEHNSETKTLE